MKTIKDRYAMAPTAKTKKDLASELHMSIGTVEAVIYGYYDRGTYKKGLTEEEKQEVLKNPENLTHEQLSEKFGVSQAHISRVSSGKVPIKKRQDPNLFSWHNNPAF